MSQRWRGRAFVSREAELAAVLSAVDGARDGVPAILLVGGEAGINKSTLVVQAQPGPASPPWPLRPRRGRRRPLASLADLLCQFRRLGRGGDAGLPLRLGGAVVPPGPRLRAERRGEPPGTGCTPAACRRSGSHQGRSDEVVELCRGALGVAEAADDHCGCTRHHGRALVVTASHRTGTMR